MQKLSAFLLILICALFLDGTSAWAVAEEESEPARDVTAAVNFKPRFLALRFDEVNLRTGPGKRHPVEWVYKRRDLPVEVIEQLDVWYRIRDWEGTTGWVHKTKLSGKRRAIVTGETRNLRSAPQDNAPVLAKVDPNVVAEILKCDIAWCKLKVADSKGYMRKTDFWGVYPTEQF